VRAGVPLLRRSLETALETGDQTYRAYGYSSLVSNFLASGAPLEDVQRETESGLEFAQKVHFGLVVDVMVGQLSFIRTLRGLTPARFARRGSTRAHSRSIWKTSYGPTPGIGFENCKHAFMQATTGRR
jgi:hypothetical protein